MRNRYEAVCYACFKKIPPGFGHMITLHGRYCAFHMECLAEHRRVEKEKKEKK